MMLFGLCSGQSLLVNCYMCHVRGAVLSLTLIGSESTRSCKCSKWCGFCVLDLPQFDDLLEDVDSTLFKQESPADADKPARLKRMQKLLQFDVFRFISPNSISPNFKLPVPMRSFTWYV